MGRPLKVVAIVQARIGSTRLPGKVMKEVHGIPMIELLLKRLGKSKRVSEIVVATTDLAMDQPLVDHVSRLGLACERGSPNDVLERYVLAARKHQADVVVRITGDCPLVDSMLVDDCIAAFFEQDLDYLSNADPPTYPDGLDVEVIKFSALEKAMTSSTDPFAHEHVTPFISKSSQFVKSVKRNSKDFSGLRWTVDYPEDFEVIKNVFMHFSPDIYFSWEDVLQLQQHQPELFQLNQSVQRNQGMQMITGQKLWGRAKSVIPGGNMLLSKRAEMFLPHYWPSYFSKAKGCKVWDLDGNEYIDMSIMGIGTNILGYGDPEVDEAVLNAVQNGNMSTLNCPEEVYLAEKLLELHPWAQMVRLARTGGEANAVAIRLARAAVGKDNVAICGYHGWHDWYLATNLGNEKGLDGHLLPGLEPNGVPRNLKGTVFPFTYNCFDELEALVNTHDIGVIKMEVARSTEPKDGFLHKIRELATNRGIVLVFDECTSGFRETFGGLHKKYCVEPDVAIFGKALGNGYAITAIIGKREIMEAAQTSFISSTFWTERIGPSAALRTLEVMERKQSWEVITQAGLSIRDRWEELAKKYDLSISHWGMPALTGFTINGSQPLAFKTLITQEMLAKGYLASNIVHVCTEHKPSLIDAYFDALDPIFRLIRECEDGRNINDLLRGPVCHGGFKRLN